MPSFLVVTTRDLPEAYFVARFLESRRQRLAILNITGRSPSRALRVLRRLGRNRGWRYVADLLAARAVGVVGGAGTTRPFADVDAATIAGLKGRSPCHEHAEPHAASTLAFVERFAPDWILLAGAPVLKPSLYGLAREGALNRHLGLLPDYRGSDCPIWALAANAMDDVGFSVHLVTERVDAGEIVLRRAVPVAAATLDEYLAVVQRRASEAFVEVLEGIIRGVSPPRQPQTGTGTYYPPAPLSAVRRAAHNLRRRAALSPRPADLDAWAGSSVGES